MQYYIIYVGHLYEMCCFSPFKRTTLQFNSSKLSIATRFNASILIAITFIHYPLSFSYIKLQAVCIQLKIHQSLSNLIKIQVGILDKNEFNFFGLIYLSFLKMGREQLRRRLSRLQWLIFLMKAHLLTFGLVVHLFRRFRVCNKPPYTLYTLHVDISKLAELSHSKYM